MKVKKVGEIRDYKLKCLYTGVLRRSHSQILESLPCARHVTRIWGTQGNEGDHTPAFPRRRPRPMGPSGSPALGAQPSLPCQSQRPDPRPRCRMEAAGLRPP